MAEYRLFFLGSDGAIEARQNFCAADDQSAIHIANMLGKASADMHHGVMLWQGIRRIFETGAKLPLPKRRVRRMSDTASKLTLEADAQQCVLDCEETLLNSHWRLAKSKTLLEATNTLRQAFKSGGSDTGAP
jgi:hypothetical protein